MTDHLYQRIEDLEAEVARLKDEIEEEKHPAFIVEPTDKPNEMLVIFPDGTTLKAVTCSAAGAYFMDEVSDG